MPDEKAQIAIRPLATDSLAILIGMEKGFMLETLRSQCFRTRDKQGNAIEVTDAQVASFVSIAVEMNVNPLLPGMLYAYPAKGGGIVPIMGPDGVFKKLSERQDIDGWDVKVFPEDVSLVPTHAIATIYRKGSSHPISYTALVSEWYVDDNPNWKSRKRHMIGLRALKHAARQVIHGLPYDEDDRHIMELTEKIVSPGAPGQEGGEERADPAALRKRRGAAKGTTAEPPAGQVIDLPPQGATPPPAEQPPAPPGAENPPAGTPPAEERGTLIPLEDKKKYTLKGAKVVSSEYENYPKDGTPRHGAKGIISSPEYTGPFIHLAGGRELATGDGIKHVVRDFWKSDTTVNVEMHGAFSKGKGKVLCMIDEVAMTGELDDAP